VEYIEDELGIKVFSLENITTIYNKIKDNVDDEIKRLWIEYYEKYGTKKLV